MVLFRCFADIWSYMMIFWSKNIKSRRIKEKYFKILRKRAKQSKSTTEWVFPLGRCLNEWRNPCGAEANNGRGNRRGWTSRIGMRSRGTQRPWRSSRLGRCIRGRISIHRQKHATPVATKWLGRCIWISSEEFVTEWWNARDLQLHSAVALKIFCLKSGILYTAIKETLC